MVECDAADDFVVVTLSETDRTSPGARLDEAGGRSEALPLCTVVCDVIFPEDVPMGAKLDFNLIAASTSMGRTFLLDFGLGSTDFVTLSSSSLGGRIFFFIGSLTIAKRDASDKVSIDEDSVLISYSPECPSRHTSASPAHFSSYKNKYNVLAIFVCTTVCFMIR